MDEIAKCQILAGRGPINWYPLLGYLLFSNVELRSWVVLLGRSCAGTPLAEGCSPSHNMDQHGPTSVLKSVSKLPTDEIVGGVLLNQK